jgi:predicted metal-dependent hydrolase
MSHHFRDAVEHFNACRFWEAHEDWETMWHEAEDPKRRWLQAMIQLAAAFFHVERGFYASGFLKLLRGAEEKWAGYAGDTEGLDFQGLLRDLDPWRAHAKKVESGRPLAEDRPPYPTLRYR